VNKRERLWTNVTFLASERPGLTRKDHKCFPWNNMMGQERFFCGPCKRPGRGKTEWEKRTHDGTGMVQGNNVAEWGRLLAGPMCAGLWRANGAGMGRPIRKRIYAFAGFYRSMYGDSAVAVFSQMVVHHRALPYNKGTPCLSEGYQSSSPSRAGGRPNAVNMDLTCRTV
jgi:hypothetical protein